MGSGLVEELNFTRIEQIVRKRVLGLAARVVEQRLNTDHSDYAGPVTHCPECHQKSARYAGRRTRNITRVLGDLRIKRAYYHCSSCAGGFCPRDQAIGLDRGSLSQGILQMVGLVGALVSFEEGQELLATLAGVTVTAKQVERSAEALGREMAIDECSKVSAPATDLIAPTLYLGIDGTGVPVRKQEVVGRKGKQPDGTAKTREAKLCVLWSAEGRDEQGNPVRDPGSVTYSASIESAARRPGDQQPPPFDLRVIREATRRGFLTASRQVIIGDGAAWIWKLAEEHFPDAIQILDRFHAKEHINDVAVSIYGHDSDLARNWRKQRYKELDDGDIAAVIRALREHANTNEEARKCLGYVRNNHKRMRYKQFREQGLCTSSGVVEAGCKTVVGTRLKRPGMHWTVAGANAIICLRCYKLSGYFDKFWKQRAKNTRPAA